MEVFECKYYLRCGMCELKKAPCDYFKLIDPPNYQPIPFNPALNMPVTVYGCPTTITCSAERSEE